MLRLDTMSSRSWWCLVSDRNLEQAKTFFTSARYILLVTLGSLVTFKHQACNGCLVWAFESNLRSNDGRLMFSILILKRLGTCQNPFTFWVFIKKCQIVVLVLFIRVLEGDRGTQ